MLQRCDALKIVVANRPVLKEVRWTNFNTSMMTQRVAACVASVSARVRREKLQKVVMNNTI